MNTLSFEKYHGIPVSMRRISINSKYSTFFPIAESLAFSILNTK